MPNSDDLSPLEKARLAVQQRRKEALESGEEIKRKTVMEAWQANPKSMRKSINAKCFDCNGGEQYRNRTKFCTVFTCPLWHVRPNAGKVTKEECLAYKED